MSTVSFRRMSALDDGQIDYAAAVMVEAFAHDPLLLPMVGGDTRLSHALFRAYIGATIVDGDAYFAELGDEVVGVALWFGQGKDFLESWEQVEAGWNNFWNRLSPAGREWWEESFTPQRNSLYSRSLTPFDSRRDSYHLAFVAVHPAFQGRGIGSELVEEGKERARRQELPITVDTPTEFGVTICRRWGFRRGGSETFMSVWRDFLLTVLIWMPE